MIPVPQFFFVMWFVLYGNQGDQGAMRWLFGKAIVAREPVRVLLSGRSARVLLGDRAARTLFIVAVQLVPCAAPVNVVGLQARPLRVDRNLGPETKPPPQREDFLGGPTSKRKRFSAFRLFAGV